MFKHILLPHDGSAISGKAIKHGIDFARKIGAKVTAIHVMPQFIVAADVSLVPLSQGLRKRLEDQARARAQKMLGEPELAKRFAAQGADPQSSSPEGLARYMRDEHERWKKIIREAGIKPE